MSVQHWVYVTGCKGVFRFYRLFDDAIETCSSSYIALVCRTVKRFAFWAAATSLPRISGPRDLYRSREYPDLFRFPGPQPFSLFLLLWVLPRVRYSLVVAPSMSSLLLQHPSFLVIPPSSLYLLPRYTSFHLRARSCTHARTHAQKRTVIVNIVLECFILIPKISFAYCST